MRVHSASASSAVYRKDNKVAPSGFEALPDSMRDPLQRAKMHAMATQMLDKRVWGLLHRAEGLLHRAERVWGLLHRAERVWGLLHRAERVWGLLHRAERVWGLLRGVVEWPYTTGAGVPPPRDPPPTKVTIVGQNEVYGWERFVGPFFVHELLGPRPPPPPPPLEYLPWPASQGRGPVPQGRGPAQPQHTPHAVQPERLYTFFH